MSHVIDEMRIYVRLERQESAGSRDDDARRKLAQEIRALIESDPDYRRIVTCGP